MIRCIIVEGQPWEERCRYIRDYMPRDKFPEQAPVDHARGLTLAAAARTTSENMGSVEPPGKACGGLRRVVPRPETGGYQTRVPHRAAQGRHRAGTALKSQINVGCSRADHKGASGGRGGPQKGHEKTAAKHSKGWVPELGRDRARQGQHSPEIAPLIHGGMMRGQFPGAGSVSCCGLGANYGPTDSGGIIP